MSSMVWRHRASWLPSVAVLLGTTLFFMATGRGMIRPWIVAGHVTEAALAEGGWRYESALAALDTCPPVPVKTRFQLDAWAGDLHRRAGMSAFLRGDFTTAIAHISAKKSGGGQDYLLRIYQGICLQKIGRPDDAIRLFTRIIDMAPHLQDAWIARGHCYLQQNDLLAAYADYRRAIQAGKHLAYIYVDIGDAFRGRGDWTTAGQFYQTALATDGSDPFALLRAAEFNEVIRHDSATARRILDKLLILRPAWEPAHHLERIMDGDEPADPGKYLSTASFPDGPVRSWEMAVSKILFEFQREDWHGYR